MICFFTLSRILASSPNEFRMERRFALLSKNDDRFFGSAIFVPVERIWSFVFCILLIWDGQIRPLRTWARFFVTLELDMIHVTWTKQRSAHLCYWRGFGYSISVDYSLSSMINAQHLVAWKKLRDRTNEAYVSFPIGRNRDSI